MIHPDLELRFINDSIGYGVFAKRFIPAGTITYVKDSLEIEVTPEDYFRHAPPMRAIIDKYSYKDERGVKIVSWDIAKFVNHSCNCNTMSTGYGFEIAIRDIQPDEEVTDEYGLFNIEEDMAVDCKDEKCRKFVRKDDIDRYHKEWDRRIQKILPRLFVEEQPLMPFVDDHTRNLLADYLKNPVGYRSVLTLKYTPVAIGS